MWRNTDGEESVVIVIRHFLKDAFLCACCQAPIDVNWLIWGSGSVLAVWTGLGAQHRLQEGSPPPLLSAQRGLEPARCCEARLGVLRSNYFRTSGKDPESERWLLAILGHLMFSRTEVESIMRVFASCDCNV